MRLALYLLGALIATGFGFWAYNVNYDTQEARKRVQTLQADIARERARTAMLQAEWAWLNRPDRLAALVAEHNATLLLMPLDPGHFADIREIAAPAPAREPGWDGLTVADIAVTIVAEDSPVLRPTPRPVRRRDLPPQTTELAQ
ncbi:MAG: cell division protein FtsL [Pseudomonadota bacterium]